jgi:hypothetical protein
MAKLLIFSMCWSCIGLCAVLTNIVYIYLKKYFTWSSGPYHTGLVWSSGTYKIGLTWSSGPFLSIFLLRFYFVLSCCLHPLVEINFNDVFYELFHSVFSLVPDVVLDFGSLSLRLSFFAVP